MLDNTSRGDATDFAVHEDTTLFGRGGNNTQGLTQGEGLECYEDTELLGRAGEMGGVGQKGYGLQLTELGCSPSSRCGTVGWGKEEARFEIYEDTELL